MAVVVASRPRLTPDTLRRGFEPKTAAVSVLLLFTTLPWPECTQNQTAVSDTLHVSGYACYLTSNTTRVVQEKYKFPF